MNNVLTKIQNKMNENNEIQQKNLAVIHQTQNNTSTQLRSISAVINTGQIQSKMEMNDLHSKIDILQID